MKLFALLAALLACGILTSCSTLSQQPETLEDVSFGIRIAADVGGQLALEADATLRPKFEAAIPALDALIQNTNLSPAVLYQIFLGLGVNELKSPYARIAVVGAELAFQRYARRYPLQTPQLVLASAMALRDGLLSALNATRPLRFGPPPPPRLGSGAAPGNVSGSPTFIQPTQRWGNNSRQLSAPPLPPLPVH